MAQINFRKILKGAMALVCLSSFLVQQVYANPFKAVVKATTKELLDDTKKNLKKPETYDKYINMAVSGNFDSTVDEIFKDLTSEFTRDKVSKALFLNMVSSMAPMALGPVKVIFDAAGVTKDYVGYMLNWVEGTVRDTFHNEVIKRSKNSSTALKSNFNYYMEERFPFLKGIVPTRRAALRQEMEQTYQKRYIALKKIELAIMARESAMRIMKRKLRIAVGQAKAKVRNAQATLKGAKEPITEENLQNFLKNKKYRSTIVSRDKENWRKFQAGEEKPPVMTVEEEGEGAVAAVELVKLIQQENKVKATQFDISQKLISLKNKLFSGSILIGNYAKLYAMNHERSSRRFSTCQEYARSRFNKTGSKSYFKDCSKGLNDYFKIKKEVDKEIKQKVSEVKKAYYALITPDFKEIYKLDKKYYNEMVPQIRSYYSSSRDIIEGDSSYIWSDKDLPEEPIQSYIFKKDGGVERQKLRFIEKSLSLYMKNLNLLLDLSISYEQKMRRLLGMAESEVKKHNKSVDSFCEKNYQFIAPSVDECGDKKKNHRIVPYLYGKIEKDLFASDKYRASIRKLQIKLKKYFKFTRSATLSNDDFFTVIDRLMKVHQRYRPIKISKGIEPVLFSRSYEKKYVNKQGNAYLLEKGARKMNNEQSLSVNFLMKYFESYLKDLLVSRLKYGIGYLNPKSQCGSSDYNGIKVECSLVSINNWVTDIPNHQAQLKVLKEQISQIRSWKLPTRIKVLSKTINEFEAARSRLTYATKEARQALSYFYSFKKSFKGIEAFITQGTVKSLLEGNPTYKISLYKNLTTDYSKYIKETLPRIDRIRKVLTAYQKEYLGPAGEIPKDYKDSLNDSVWKHVIKSPEIAKMFSKAIKNINSKSQQNFIRDDTASIKQFYKDFKRAYERKREGVLLSMIDNGWTASEDTGVDELEENLIRTFDIFDRISFVYSNIKIKATGNSRLYEVSYNLKIKSKIYKRQLSRKEGSSVKDLVLVSGSKGEEKVKIIKTLHGNLWLVE